MALINCPECGKEISDKAASCPNCGCPIAIPVEHKKTDREIKKEKTGSGKKILIPIILAVVIIAVVAVVVVVTKNNGEKKKRDDQLSQVKAAMDKVDDAMVALLDFKDNIDPFLYGSADSSEHVKTVKGIIDTITDNQKIVNDAYKNEDKEFTKELDDYVASQKVYRSWEEFNEELKKLYDNTLTNEKAAEKIVQSLASTEKEYRDFKNHYFVMKRFVKNGVLEDFDITKCLDTDRIKKVGNGYQYEVDIMVQYLGDKHPTSFDATFYLIGAKGNIIASGVSADRKTVYDDTGYPNGSWSKGLNYGEHFSQDMVFVTETDEIPVDVIMDVTKYAEKE